MAGNNVRQECLARAGSACQQDELGAGLKVWPADFAERVDQAIGKGCTSCGIILGGMGLVRGFEKCECAGRITS